MATQQNLNQTVTNLGTTTLQIVNTDIYTVRVKLQIPNIVPSATQGAGGGAGTGTGGGPQVASQVVCTIAQTGSFTGTLGASAPGSKGLTLQGISCTAGDTITVTLSSSLLQDEQLEAVQATISLSEGPN